MRGKLLLLVLVVTVGAPLNHHLQEGYSRQDARGLLLRTGCWVELPSGTVGAVDGRSPAALKLLHCEP